MRLIATKPKTRKDFDINEVINSEEDTPKLRKPMVTIQNEAHSETMKTPITINFNKDKENQGLETPNLSVTPNVTR